MRSGIRWSPIETIPAELKDGRTVLLWAERAPQSPMHFGWFGGEGVGWLIDGTSARVTPAFFAEITVPNDGFHEVDGGFATNGE